MNSSLEPHWNRHTIPLIFVSSGPNLMWKLFLRVQIHLLCAKNRKNLHSILSQGSSEFSKRLQSQSCKSTRRLQLWILVKSEKSSQELNLAFSFLYLISNLFSLLFFTFFFIIASANSWVGLHPLFSSAPSPPPCNFCKRMVKRTYFPTHKRDNQSRNFGTW